MHKRAFSLIELLVVIAIIASLAAMLVPTIAMVRERAKRASCGMNMHSLTAATFAYTTDNEGLLMNGDRGSTSGSWYSPAYLQIEQYLVNAQQANSSAAAGAPFRFMHCPANPKGNLYGCFAAQPVDFPATLERLMNFVKKQSPPGGRTVLWADVCFLDGNNNAGDFVTACNHKGLQTGSTTGIPTGGNCAYADGSVSWMPYKGNVTVPDPAFIINSSTLGGSYAIPNCAVWLRLNADGTLDTTRADNLVLGRTTLNHAANF